MPVERPRLRAERKSGTAPMARAALRFVTLIEGVGVKTHAPRAIRLILAPSRLLQACTSMSQLTATGPVRSQSVSSCLYENCRRGDKHLAAVSDRPAEFAHRRRRRKSHSRKRSEHLFHLGRRVPIAGGLCLRDARSQHGRGRLLRPESM